MRAMMSGGDVLQWRPELGTRIGLQSRRDGTIKWIGTEPFFVFHFANAYEKDQKIIIDYAHHSALKFLDREPENFSPPMMYRTVIDLDSLTLSHTQMDEI